MEWTAESTLGWALLSTLGSMLESALELTLELTLESALELTLESALELTLELTLARTITPISPLEPARLGSANPVAILKMTQSSPSGTGGHASCLARLGRAIQWPPAVLRTRGVSLILTTLNLANAITRVPQPKGKSVEAIPLSGANRECSVMVTMVSV
jgi:hypothetical protein